MKSISVEIPSLGGCLVATPNEDPDYPGIDVEFIPDGDIGKNVSRPRVLIEAPSDRIGLLRALIWRDPKSEDYTCDVELMP